MTSGAVTSTDRARLAAAVAASRQGLDTVVLDVGPVFAIVDYFVITTATNPRLARTIAEEIEDRLRLQGGGPLRVEGLDDARWILVDFGDVVVHVLAEEARAYYDLERLWGDVARLDWEDGLEVVSPVGAEVESGPGWSGSA